MAWNAAIGSSEQAWMHRSPPERSGSSVSGGSRGRSARAAGRLAASPKRSSNSDGPKPTVMVRLAGHRPAGGHLGGRRRPRLEQGDQGRLAFRQRPVDDQVVRGEGQPGRRRGGDAGLVGAVERDGVIDGGLVIGGFAGDEAGQGGAGDRGPAPTEHRAPGGAWIHRQLATWAATWDSGSASASTF
jgi:hypothetical protein